MTPTMISFGDIPLRAMLSSTYKVARIVRPPRGDWLVWTFHGQCAPVEEKVEVDMQATGPTQRALVKISRIPCARSRVFRDAMPVKADERLLFGFLNRLPAAAVAGCRDRRGGLLSFAGVGESHNDACDPHATCSARCPGAMPMTDDTFKIAVANPCKRTRVVREGQRKCDERGAEADLIAAVGGFGVGPEGSLRRIGDS